MTDRTLGRLLAGNADHADSLPADHFAAVKAGQRPAVVSVCCSDSRVSQEGMFDVTEPGWLFTPSTIGNLAWDRHDGRRVLDGSVAYPLVYTDTRVAVVVGHTGCGAVTAALDAVREGGDPAAPPGVRRRVGMLRPVVEDGLAGPVAAGADAAEDADDGAGTVDRLVEYNVDRQVAFLVDSEDVPGGVSTYGFVYDLHGVYGDVRGRAYLTNADGETDPETLREAVPEGFEGHVRRLS